MAEPKQEWFTAHEAAEYLRIAVSTVYRLTQRGELRAYHIGRARRYKRRDLDALPKRRNAKAAAAATREYARRRAKGGKKRRR